MRIVSLFFLFSFFTLLNNSLSAQENTENKATWEDVFITKNNDDVKDLVKIGEIEASAQKVFGSQSSLKKKAREKLKKEAFNVGATVVLIQDEEFSATPVNNVYIIGIAYKKDN